MSSHHIVRDEQEPALILHKIGNFPRHILYSLLEWSPTVVGCESVINEFTSLGHKLDVVLVGLQNFSDWQRDLDVQQPIKILAVNEEDHLMSGLTILQREGHKAINVVTEEELVMDLMSLFVDWIELLDIVVYTKTRRVLIVRNTTFRKWLPPHSTLQLVSLQGHGEWDITGLVNQNNMTGRLTITTQQEGDVIIQSNQPPFLVFEEL